MNNVIVSREAFADALVARGVARSVIHLGDRAFNMPTVEWVTGDFSRWLTRRFYNRPYLEDAFDCDNFVLEAHACACEAHRRSVEAGIGDLAGNGFGQLWVRRRVHGLNLCGHWREGSGIWIATYEPQVSFDDRHFVIEASMRQVTLSPEDWQSVEFALAI